MARHELARLQSDGLIQFDHRHMTLLQVGDLEKRLFH
jgi:hypothetical protein